MSTSSILDTLRNSEIMVINPPGDVSDSLVLKLIHIGCSVRHFWPPPKRFDRPIDLVFTGIFQNYYHEQISGLIATSEMRITVVALVEYESPAILSQIIELSCHGVIVQPLGRHMVLPVLVSARRNSEEIARLKQKNTLLLERLGNLADINQAKLLLMTEHGWVEEQAHSFLSREAMKCRKTILAIAREIVKRHMPD
ncbi:ANTAR domain-containing response regulator [Pseudomonas fluorescens]|uniref:Aliphatic amidase regulator n=1 Tax=Pseudomonas fluorescens TaxID=294 RepID=A0A423LFR8_PSEFL|nr:ANTAR domain-containing protein [Pseudomonas fluorescens]RON67171.1 aliphatic amidase regulator [Pseudomonas fluorescens]